MFGMPLFIKSRPDVEQSDLMAKETNSKPVSYTSDAADEEDRVELGGHP